jgi:hypothetical protein
MLTPPALVTNRRECDNAALVAECLRNRCAADFVLWKAGCYLHSNSSCGVWLRRKLPVPPISPRFNGGCLRLWRETIRLLAVCPFETYVVSPNHAVECLAIDFQHARCRLLVASRVRQHTRHMAPFNLRQ